MAFSNQIKMTTEDKYVPKVVETVLSSNPFLSSVLTRTKRWKGAKMNFPVRVLKTAPGQSFSGFDVLPTVANDTRRKLEFNHKNYAKGVAVAKDALSVNSGSKEERFLDLAEQEMNDAALDMAEELGTMFYGDGTGNGGKDFLGLEAMVDDGSTTVIYGGLSRATYTGLQSTVLDASTFTTPGLLTLSVLRTLTNSIRKTNNKPTAIYTTYDIYGLLESIIQPQARYNKSATSKERLIGQAGFAAIYWDGLEIIADAKCPDGTLYMLDESSFDFYATDFVGAKAVNLQAPDKEIGTYSGVKGFGFQWTGWREPTDQEAYTGRIILSGEFICKNPRANGKITNITHA